MLQLLAKWVMVAFVTVLVDVERSFKEAEKPFAPPYFAVTPPVAPRVANAPTTAHVVAAYQCFGKEPPATASQGNPDWFPQILSEAAHSPRNLQALRRRLAWRLHPDRASTDENADATSLGEINAAIDAALARCSSGKAE